MRHSRRRLLTAGIAAPVLAVSAPAVHAASRPRIGIAFGSGSRHGLVHVGIIKALAEAGLRPQVVTGTSAGAIAGALWASGLEWDRIRQAAGEISWLEGGRLSFDLGLLSNESVRRLVRERTAGRPMEDWPIRFGAVAADFATGERVLLSSGDPGDAVAASASMPVLYAPVTIGGRGLVDGALVEPVPIRAARELGAEVVIAVDVAFRPAEEPPGSVLDAPFQAMHILVNRLIEEQIGEADFAIRLNVHHLFAAPDTDRRLLAAGERAVRERWPAIQAALQAPAGGPPRKGCAA
jgi:NTE family protein